MEQINYCPRCGSPMKMMFRHERVRPICTKCGYVFYLNPVVAAGTLVEEDGRVALIRRGIEPGFGLWGLPAGYVEADETAEEAAARETFEETGLKVEVDDLLDVYSFGDEDQPRGVLILYAAHVVGGELVAGDDASDARFFTPADLPPDPEIAFDTHRQALGDWRRVHAIQVHPAIEAEASKITDLSARYREDTSTSALDLHTTGQLLLVATDAEQLVGFVAMKLDEQRQGAYIDQLFVLPAYRRWGIGTRLVNAAIEHARTRGMASLNTEVLATNRGMLVYLKAGFRVCGYLDRPTPRGEPPFQASLFLTYNLGEE